MSGQGLLVVMNDVLPRREAEFRQWCSVEYLPELRGVPGVLSARLHRATAGAPEYLLLVELSSVDVLDQPEYLRVRGWGPGDEGVAANMFLGCPNLTVGAYEYLVTVPAPGSPDPSSARGLMLRGLEMDIAEAEEEFHAWYNTDHIPALLTTPGAIRSRRYRLSRRSVDKNGILVKWLAVYDAATPEIFMSQDWMSRANTPWTEWMRRYYSSPLRTVYEPLS